MKYRILVTSIVALTMTSCDDCEIPGGSQSSLLSPVREIRAQARDHWPTMGTPISGVFGTAWSSDGKMVAFYTDYGYSVEIWNVDGTLKKIVKRDCESLSICSQSLAFIDGDRKLLMGPSGPGSWSDMSPEQHHLLNNSLLTVYDLDKDSFQQVTDAFQDNNQVANSVDRFIVSPDNKYIAMSFDSPRVGTIEIRKIDGWAKVTVLRPTSIERMILGSMAFSPDNQTLAVVDYSRLKMYSISSWKLIYEVEPFQTTWKTKPVTLAIGSIAFSPDSKYLAVESQGVGDRRDKISDSGYDLSRGPINVYNLKTLSIEPYSLDIPSELMSFGRDVIWISPTSLALLTLRGCIVVWDFTAHEKGLPSVFVSRLSSDVTYVPPKKLLAVTTASGIQLFAPSIK